MKIESGDMVLLITDGILEARSPEDCCFGESRLLDVIRINCQRPAAQIVAAIHTAVQQFTGLEHMQDDLTAVVVKCLRDSN